jgi:hypothetical protein
LKEDTMSTSLVVDHDWDFLLHAMEAYPTSRPVAPDHPALATSTDTVAFWTGSGRQDG